MIQAGTYSALNQTDYCVPQNELDDAYHMHGRVQNDSSIKFYHPHAH